MRGAPLVAVLLVALGLAAVAPPATAITRLEGYSSLMTELRSDKGGDESWQLENPQLYSELRIKTSPWADTDTYLKMVAESNRWEDDAKAAKFFMTEAHMRFRREHLEAHFFGGQNRFWLNEPLLEIVNQDMVKHDDYGPRAQGIRLDFWDVYGFTGAAFVSERSDYFQRAFSELSDEDQSFYDDYADGDTLTVNTDDYRALRLNRSLAGNRLFTGVTYARKDFTRYGDNIYHGRHKDYDEVVAFDIEFAIGDLVPPLGRFGRMTWATEVGRNVSGWLTDVDDPEPNGFKTEIRDLKIGPFRCLGSYEDYGVNFYSDGLASQDRRNLNDYSKYYGEVRYRVPTKAVNLKGWIWQAKPETPGLTSQSESVGTQDEWGTEAYMEFLNGFKGLAQYKVYEDRNGTWPNVFFELTGENRLVKLRAQYRIRDIDTDYEVNAYGFEANVNLGESWKFYSRVMNVEENTEARQTAFAQLRYLGWPGAEFFVEFGNPDQSNDLVNDGDFVDHGSSATTERVFKAFVRIYY